MSCPVSCVLSWALTPKGVVFLVGLNGYNQRLFEDTSVNKMHESLKLFQQVGCLDTRHMKINSTL